MAGAGLQRHGVRHIRGERALVAAHAATLIVILSEINSGTILIDDIFVLTLLFGDGCCLALLVTMQLL